MVQALRTLLLLMIPLVAAALIGLAPPSHATSAATSHAGFLEPHGSLAAASGSTAAGRPTYRGLLQAAPQASGVALLGTSDAPGYEAYGSAGSYVLYVEVVAGNEPLNVELMGCYRDAAEGRTLPDLLGDLSNMTTAACRKLSAAKRYRYYATQAGSQCWGGNVDPTFLGLVDDGCQVPCAGNDTIMCGGILENKLYRISDTDREFMGCYLNMTDWQVNLTSSAMTPWLCREWATAHARGIYALKNGTICLAIDRPVIPKGTKVPDGTCNKPCAGSRSSFCGGAQALSVYAVIGEQDGGMCNVSVEWGRRKSSWIALNEIRLVRKSGKQLAAGEFTALLTSTQQNVSRCFDGDLGTTCATATNDPNPKMTFSVPCSGSATAALGSIEVYNTPDPCCRNTSRDLTLTLRNKAGSVERAFAFKTVQDKYVFDTSQPTDQDVCPPGFGGDECVICPPGTFSPGWSIPVGDKRPAPACQPCPAGSTTAQAGSNSSGACFALAPCAASMAQNVYCVGCSVAIQGNASVCLANGSTPCQINGSVVSPCSSFGLNATLDRQDGCYNAWNGTNGVEYQFRERRTVPPLPNVTSSCTQPAPFVKLRLIKDGQENRSEGRLEVLMGSWWGAVCGDTFQAEEARVVCRMQGKSLGKPRISSAYGVSTTLGVVMSKVDCNGTEKSLGDCRFDRVRGTCSKGGHTGVQCFDNGDDCYITSGGKQVLGKFNGTGSCVLKSCLQGYYYVLNATVTQPTCVACPANATSLGAGATSVKNCTACRPGYGAVTGPFCSACANNTYSLGGNASTLVPRCTACPAGTRTTVPGATSVLNCTSSKSAVTGPLQLPSGR